MQVDISFLGNYTGVNANKNLHPNYLKTVELKESLEVHSDGRYSERLIGGRRPSESVKIQDYRKEIFVSITKPIMAKVFNTLNKIRRSPDFAVQFKQDDTTVRDGEGLEDYVTENYPRTTSVVNWFFNVAFKKQLTDANSVILVMPYNINTAENEYYQPYCQIFDSCNVIDYNYDKYYVLKSEEKASYTDGKHSYNDGFVYYVVTDTHIQRFDQIDVKGNYTEVWVYEHNIGTPPVVTMAGVAVSYSNNYMLFESRLSPMIPHMDEAIREYSDLQAEVVQHVHTTMWAHQGQECNACHGIGEVIKKGNSIPVKCTACNGEGVYPFNPYSNIVIPKAKPGQAPIAPPFAGHIEKDLGIAELQDKRVRQHKYDALAAINFEHLAESPLDQSGVAKQYDVDGANNTVHSIGEDAVRVLDDIMYFINEQRYMVSIPDKEKREALLPIIYVPEKFDLLSESYLIDGITKAMAANVDPSILNALQVEYANKRFSTNSNIKDRLLLKLKLDPLSSMKADDIVAGVGMDLITKKDAIIHVNINKFIDMAYAANKDFNELKEEQKKEVIDRYADEYLKAETVNGNQ